MVLLGSLTSPNLPWLELGCTTDPPPHTRALALQPPNFWDHPRVRVANELPSGATNERLLPLPILVPNVVTMPLISLFHLLSPFVSPAFSPSPSLCSPPLPLSSFLFSLSPPAPPSLSKSIAAGVSHPRRSSALPRAVHRHLPRADLRHRRGGARA